MFKQINKSEGKNREMDVFRPLNYFMIRTPIMPLDFYKEIFNSSLDQPLSVEKIILNIQELANDPFVQEAIMLSSYSLYQSIMQLDKIDDSKKYEKVIHSLSNYLIRISTRATPFGINAGIADGKWGCETSLDFKTLSSHEKRARPDMSWVLSLVKLLESNIEVVKQLNVNFNSIVIDNGIRLQIPYNSKCGQNSTVDSNHSEIVSIRKTPVIDLIMEITKEPMKVNEIIKLLQSYYPDTPDSKIHLLILRLIEKEYLITELRPPLMTTSPFQYLTDKLKKIQGIQALKEKLIKINNLINSYNQLPIGKGMTTLKNLFESMQSIVNTKDLIQVDTKLESNRITLNVDVGKEIAKVAEIMWKLTEQDIGLNHIKEYRNEFIARYGINRAVPVLELLDDNKGLGSPASYELPKSSREEKYTNSIKQEKIENFLLLKLLDSIRDNRFEILLDTEEIEKLCLTNVDYNSIPSSLEVCGNIVAIDKDEIDKGNFRFVIGANPGSDAAGRSFGRFVDILDQENFKDNCQEIWERERKEENIIYSELVYLPSIAKAANVTLSHNFRDYEIAIGTNSSKDANHTIPLSDIVVIADLNRFYLMSKSLGKRIIVTLNHMLNIHSAPNICRFLVELSQEGIRQWAPFTWYSLKNSSFLPRVCVGRTVISLATWNINNSILGLNGSEDFMEWKKVFYQWARNWKMPKLVYHTIGDNRLLIDIYNEYHLYKIYCQVKKLKEYQRLMLVEKLDSNLDDWVKDSRGRSYSAEFVFPLIKNKYISQENNIQISTHLDVISEASDLVKKFPGSDWLYIKIYDDNTREKELISTDIRDFCADLEANNVIDRFFFIRYADPKSHIRLRFQGSSTNFPSKLITFLNKWSQELQRKGLIQKLEISTYEREVVRYGGPELINEAEKLFYHDSKCVIDLFSLIARQEIQLDLDEIAVLSIVHYLECCGLSFDEQLKYFNNIVDYRSYAKEFRKKRRELITLANVQSNWVNLQEIQNGTEILCIFEQRREVIAAFFRKMKELNMRSKLYNTPNDILGSIIHLHLNRLIGTDNQREEKIMSMVRHTLYSLRYLNGSTK
ncbi:lantibiotic dehydratase [Bacillus mobilis]|uniref:lantibiotic dehydratase n=1 Tax=Bacillus mobilis TaxID=2026190 RepID=UPI002E1F0D68|nr:lantibiotic dehydratase [Bacillus mobilis]